MSLNPVEQARADAVGEAALQAGEQLREIVEGLLAAGGPDVSISREASGLVIAYAVDRQDGLMVATLDVGRDRVLQIRAVPDWPTFIRCERIGPWAGQLADLHADMKAGQAGPQPGEPLH